MLEDHDLGTESKAFIERLATATFAPLLDAAMFTAQCAIDVRERRKRRRA